MKGGQRKKSILITGGGGRLGKYLKEAFSSYRVRAPSRAELDIASEASVRRFFAKRKFDVIIHAAAMTSVDQCEINRKAAWKTNVHGTGLLVEAVRTASPQTLFVYLSTACVFYGDRGNYSEADLPRPKNFYGMTKFIAEQVVAQLPKHLIVRTNFVDVGPWPHPGAFTDRYGTYLYAPDVAAALSRLVRKNTQGLVHVRGSRRYSLFEMAQRASPLVKPITMSIKTKHLTKDMTLTSIRLPAYKLGFSFTK